MADISSLVPDWIFRGLSAITPVLAGAVGYVLHRNDSRVADLEGRITSNENLVQQGQMAGKDMEIEMGKLRLHISENYASKPDIQASLERVHEKIEAGNKKTDDMNEAVSNKIDQLRRDLQADIRSALALPRS